MRASTITALVSGTLASLVAANIVATWIDYRTIQDGGQTALPYREGDFAGLFWTNGFLILALGFVLLVALLVRFDR